MLINKLVTFVFLSVITSSFAEAKCMDQDALNVELNSLGIGFKPTLPFSSCPIKKAKIRKPDKYAKEGGNFFSNRGINKCHFALDLEVVPNNMVITQYGFGTPAYAAGKGTVVLASKKWGAAGRTVIIDHGDNIYSLYAHLSEINVKTKKNIKSGDLIGKVGYSGNAKKLKKAGLSPHLHFTVFKTVQPISSFKPISVVKEIESVNDQLPFMKGFGFIDPTNWLKGQGCI